MGKYDMEFETPKEEAAYDAYFKLGQMDAVADVAECFLGLNERLDTLLEKMVNEIEVIDSCNGREGQVRKILQKYKKPIQNTFRRAD
jgi:hypothetical protein